MTPQDIYYMELSINQLLIGYIFYYLNPTYMVLAILYLFNYKYYTINGDKDKTNHVIKKLEKINVTHIKHINGKDHPIGYFWTYKCMGFIDSDRDNVRIDIITKPSFYKDLIEENDICFTDTIGENLSECQTQSSVQNKIVVYNRKGSNKNFYYQSIKLNMNHIQPIGDQLNIVENIVEIYNKLDQATVFINGVTCAGKSTIGYLVAKQLNGIYCHSFNPTEPGDRFSSLIGDIDNDDKPIIIVLEEIDNIIKDIHNGYIKKNHEVPISVHNKSTWSSFLDDMIFYKKVILILTSNTPKEKIDAMDESYLRKGRIHASYSMLHKLVV